MSHFVKQAVLIEQHNIPLLTCYQELLKEKTRQKNKQEAMFMYY